MPAERRPSNQPSTTTSGKDAGKATSSRLNMRDPQAPATAASANRALTMGFGATANPSAGALTVYHLGKPVQQNLYSQCQAEYEECQARQFSPGTLQIVLVSRRTVEPCDSTQHSGRHDARYRQNNGTDCYRLGQIIRGLNIPNHRDCQNQTNQAQFPVLKEVLGIGPHSAAMLMCPDMSHGRGNTTRPNPMYRPIHISHLADVRFCHQYLAVHRALREINYPSKEGRVKLPRSQVSA